MADDCFIPRVLLLFLFGLQNRGKNLAESNWIFFPHGLTVGERGGFAAKTHSSILIPPTTKASGELREGFRDT